MSAALQQTNTVETSTDRQDGQIRLVDSTTPTGDAAQLTSGESWRRLARIPTKTSVKEELSRRKYASWRKDKFESEAERSAADTEPALDECATVDKQKPKAVVIDVHPDNEESQTADFGARPSTSDQSQAKPYMTAHSKGSKGDHEIDILYENQRGSFFCGIPLYSHSSLLNFDPAAWVTRDFRDSPVNITNAQVPNPSWIWAWKTWYVDMTGDVDEEGWQYSFMFGNKFAWHGTHPWFHSFVRRRRWLRKRIKRTDGIRRDKVGTIEAAHHLNADYFTIHSKTRDRSPVGDTSNPEATLARPISFTSFTSTVEDELKKPEEIKDIPSLLKTIRLSSIDREKVDAVKQFISTSGEEIAYLEEKMPEIMSSLVFQNSNRQILQYLKDQADQAQKHRDEHDAEDRPEGEAEKRRIDNLLKAAEAGHRQIQGLEYWSDRKHVLRTEDELDQDEDYQVQQSRQGVGEIRGISEKAETTAQLRVDRRLTNKGKAAQRTHQNNNDGAQDLDSEPRIVGDTLLIPDEDDDDNKSVDEDAWKGSGQPIYL